MRCQMVPTGIGVRVGQRRARLDAAPLASEPFGDNVIGQALVIGPPSAATSSTCALLRDRNPLLECQGRAGARVTRHAGVHTDLHVPRCLAGAVLELARVTESQSPLSGLN
jgi:hypothetical protein